MRTYLCLVFLFIFGSQVSAGDSTFSLIEQLSGLPSKDRVDSLVSIGQRLSDSDIEQALSILRTALTLSESTGYTKGQAETHANLGLIFYNKKEYEKAQEEYGYALSALKGDETYPHTDDLYRMYGNALHRNGDNEGAEKSLRKARQLAIDRNDSLGTAMSVHNFAFMNFRISNFDTAMCIIKWRMITTIIWAKKTWRPECSTASVRLITSRAITRRR